MRWLAVLLLLPLAHAGPNIGPSSCTSGAEFNFEVDQVTVDEFVGTFEVAITRAGTFTMIDCDEDVFVRMLPHDKRLPATSGQDFRQQYISVNFEPQQKLGHATITINDDAIKESSEWFILQLDHFDPDALGPRDEIEVMILDDKGGFKFATPSKLIPFGQTSTSIRIERTGETADAISATAELIQNSVNSSRSPLVRTFVVSFGPGGTSADLSVQLNTSAAWFPRATLQLRDATPAGETFIGLPDTMLIALERDPSQPDPEAARVAFTSAVYRVNEEDGGIILDVIRSGNISRVFTVNYTTENGTADLADYTGASGILSFDAGQSRKTFVVAVADDDQVEQAETIWLRLYDPVGAALDPAAASIIVILDDDKAATSTTTSTPEKKSPGPGFVAGIALLAAVWLVQRRR